MDTFLIFNVNPALIIALFPAEIISGRLHVTRTKWMELFGAVAGAKLEPDESVERNDEPSKGLLRKVAGLSLTNKASADTLRTAAQNDDTASVASAEPTSAVVPLDDSM
jgi:hypothetical protein